MHLITRGRVAPSPPPKINSTNKIKFVGVYSWNAPKESIGKERPLTRDEFHQGQAILNKIHSLPHFLSGIFAGRHEYLRKTSGLLTAHRFLFNVFMPRIWPRIEIVNHKYAQEFDGRALQLLSEEAETYRQLPGMNDRELKLLAMRMSSRLFTEYEDLSDQYIAQHDGEQSALFTDRAQQEIYGQIAGIARRFNVRPMHWKKYCKRKMDMRAAFSSIARLVNDEWWVRQFKAQRMQWREALLIAVGEVNLQKSGYASKQAIRDVRARRLAAMEYLKSCDLENVETGERTQYHLQRSEWSIHFNVTADGALFCGDGGDPGQVARAKDGQWIYLFRPRRITFEGMLNQKDFIQPGVFNAEKLVNMSKHNYKLEPNVSFTPDQKWVVFRSNMFGDTYTFAVEVEKAK